MTVDPGSRGWNEHRHRAPTPIWIVPTFNTNWSAWGIPFAPVGYTLMNGIVYLRGLVVKSVAVVDGETIFTLPAGYRPTIQSMFSCPNAGGLCRVDVTLLGTVLIYGSADGGSTLDPPSNTWTSLSPIFFPAAQ